MTNLARLRQAPLQEVIDRVDVGDPKLVSPIILSVSSCRSGSTIMLRVFGAVGVTSFFQELKYIQRWRMLGGESSWKIPQRPEEPIYLKETLGPYTRAGSEFNPVDVLLGAGFPPEKLHVLILGRAPLSTWLSWQVWWGDRTSVEYFVTTYQTVERIRQQARRLRIASTVLVYEAARDNKPELVIQNLFGRLGVAYAPIAVRGWAGLPPFGAPGSNVVLPRRPPMFLVPGLHHRVETADRFTCVSRAADIPGLDAAQVKRIRDAGVADLYDRWRAACERDLRVAVQPDQEWALYEKRELAGLQDSPTFLSGAEK